MRTLFTISKEEKNATLLSVKPNFDKVCVLMKDDENNCENDIELVL